MRLRSFACSSFGLLALGVNFFRCMNFFRLRMASPCASIVALCPILTFGCREVHTTGAMYGPFPCIPTGLNRLIGPLGSSFFCAAAFHKRPPRGIVATDRGDDSNGGK